jgi:hypothetical protein
VVCPKLNRPVNCSRQDNSLTWRYLFQLSPVENVFEQPMLSIVKTECLLLHRMSIMWGYMPRPWRLPAVFGRFGHATPETGVKGD